METFGDTAPTRLQRTRHEATGANTQKRTELHEPRADATQCEKESGNEDRIERQRKGLTEGESEGKMSQHRLPGWLKKQPRLAKTVPFGKAAKTRKTKHRETKIPAESRQSRIQDKALQGQSQEERTK